MSKRYAINYEGWFLVDAATEEEAAQVANEILSSSNLINNGESGEWLLAEIEEDN